MRPHAGFSLLEVMCAVVLLGIGLAGLTQGLTTALSSSKESERQTAAALLAAGQIEQLRARGYLTDGETEGEGAGGLALYRWKQTISRTDIDGLHEVVVAVELAKTSRPIYELRTLLFDPPVDSLADARPGSRDSRQTGREKKGGKR
jgi:prepilin-type N-terminal cleavage/methylation domain-containing protein